MQIITIVEDNHVTGVVYGTVEIHDEKIIKQKRIKTSTNIQKQIVQRQYSNTRRK